VELSAECERAGHTVTAREQIAVIASKNVSDYTVLYFLILSTKVTVETLTPLYS
jgi:hypothetical protein